MADAGIVNLAAARRARDAGESAEGKGVRIVIAPGLWRGFEVSVEPPSSAHKMKLAKSFDDALAHAEALNRETGWPIFSLADPEPPRAA